MTGIWSTVVDLPPHGIPNCVSYPGPASPEPTSPGFRSWLLSESAILQILLGSSHHLLDECSTDWLITSVCWRITDLGIGGWQNSPNLKNHKRNIVIEFLTLVLLDVD